MISGMVHHLNIKHSFIFYQFPCPVLCVLIMFFLSVLIEKQRQQQHTRQIYIRYVQCPPIILSHIHINTWIQIYLCKSIHIFTCIFLLSISFNFNMFILFSVIFYQFDQSNKKQQLGTVVASQKQLSSQITQGMVSGAQGHTSKAAHHRREQHLGRHHCLAQLYNHFHTFSSSTHANISFYAI